MPVGIMVDGSVFTSKGKLKPVLFVLFFIEVFLERHFIMTFQAKLRLSGSKQTSET